MATKFEKLLRGPLSGKNHHFGNYLMKYPQFNDTMDEKQRVLLNEDGIIMFGHPILRRQGAGYNAGWVGWLTRRKCKHEN